MTTLLGPEDTDVSSGQVTRRPARKGRIIMLTILGALIVAVPVVVIAVANRPGDVTSTVLPPDPVVAPPAPVLPSASAPGGPTVPNPAAQPPAAPRVPNRYRMVPLGFSAEVTAVNDRGDMVGARAFAGTVTHPFLWRNGKLTDLGELKPTVDGSGRATDINNRSEIVGVSNTESRRPPVRERAFIWRDGVMSPLMALDTESIANAINDNGQVVGRYSVGEQTYAFLWHDGVLTDLGAGEAVDINDRGQIVGTNAAGPWIWYRGRFTYLETPVEGMRVFALNNAGWAIGSGHVDWEHDPQETRSGAHLWRTGTVIDLGKIGIGFTTPRDINDWGQIVGATNRNNADYSIPFVWQDGQMIDLTKHGVPRVGRDLACIDNRGRLVGTAIVDGREQVVMYV